MFNCNCPPGYKGSTCNEDRNECDIGPNPCEHGGQCKNTDGSFTCKCVRGYSGPRCEQDVNECASSPCLNDGTCLDRIGEYTCICMPGNFLKKLKITKRVEKETAKCSFFELSVFVFVCLQQTAKHSVSDLKKTTYFCYESIQTT
ncbi:hypothetical protein XENOCAPTIV_016820 [Xenoophorus captivus]|uniref:EGF-like domain-containing protein n=1 Tax=Xenoophorus captivus TaxID=1517983 RepID=A0ABV0S1A9_9TELE